MEDKVALLRGVPLFAGCGLDVLQELGGIAEEVEVKPGTVLTHEGRHEGFFFAIVSGSVRIERGGQTVNTMGPGDFLGEIALLDAGPRTATAVAETPATLLKITNEAFSQLIDESADVRTAVLAAAGARLRAMDSESV